MERDAVFVPAFGNRPGQLIGREDIIQNFISGISGKTGSKDRAVLFLGQRGLGKTVLLLELADRAREHGFIVASPTIVSSGMSDRIIEKIQEEGEEFLKAGKAKLTGGSLGAFGFSVGLQFSDSDRETKSFSYKLSKLCDALNEKGRGVLILIDEVQGGSVDLKELIIAYQELVGKNNNIAIALAGLPAAISGTLNDKVLTFLNRARKVHLNALKTEDIDTFYQHAFSDLRLKVSGILRRQMADATKGSPYMMQLIGYYSTAFAKENGEVTEYEYRKVLRSAEEDFINDICQTTLNTLSEKDVAFLRAMAEDQSETKVADIAIRMGVGSDYVQIYKRRLLDAGVIEQVGRGVIRFGVPYLRECLRDDLMLEEQLLIRSFHQMDPEQKKRLLAYMEKLLHTPGSEE